MMSVSLDGYIEGPNREIDWHLVDDEVHHHFNEELKRMGAFLSGTGDLRADGRIRADGRFPEDVERLKAQPGGDLALGGADLSTRLSLAPASPCSHGRDPGSICGC